MSRHNSTYDNTLARLWCGRCAKQLRILAVITALVTFFYVISEVRNTRLLNTNQAHALDRTLSRLGDRLSEHPRPAEGAEGDVFPADGALQDTPERNPDRTQTAHPEPPLDINPVLDYPVDAGAETRQDPPPIPADVIQFRSGTPIVWVGGIPRSGTTLTRVMLDAHPDIRCGEETRVIPRVLSLNSAIERSGFEVKRLAEAHITQDILDDALGAYLLTIIARHGEMAHVLCNKDPFTAKHMTVLVRVFPNSRILLMIRDGRATCHSIITRHVSIGGFDGASYEGCLKHWSKALKDMVDQCSKVGPESCMMLYYEQLVLHPRATMEEVLQFVGVPWDDIVLHHETALNQTGDISLSDMEPSTDQVVNPVNSATLTSWVDAFPEDLRDRVATLAPLMVDLGYDIENYPPVYGTPDDEVARANEALKDQINDVGLLGRVPKRVIKKPSNGTLAKQTRNIHHRAHQQPRRKP